MSDLNQAFKYMKRMENDDKFEIEPGTASDIAKRFKVSEVDLRKYYETYSEDIESGTVEVGYDEESNTVQIVGSEDDV